MKCEKIKVQKMVGNLLDKLRKLYMHEWNSPQDIFSCPQTKDNSRQYLLLQTDILQKTVVGCPRSIMQDFLTCHCMGDEFEYERRLLVFRGILTGRFFTAAGIIWISMGKPLQPNKISKKQPVF